MPGPEDLEVRLVPDLEPPGAHLVTPIALDEVSGEVADELLPASPVLRRRDDRPVVEHRPVRIARQVVGHEADLDDRAQPELENTVVDAVDTGEVVVRLPVHLAVDAEVVVEDRMGVHRPHSELVVGEAQRLGELVADVPAAVADAVVELGEALGTDHRPPRPGERADVPSAEIWIRQAASPSGRATASTGSLAGCSWSSTAATAATVYHAGRPVVPVVSVSGG